MLKDLMKRRPWLTAGTGIVAGAIAVSSVSIGFAATDRNPTWVEAAAGDTWQSIATAKGLTGSGSGTDGTVSTAGDKLQRANRVGVSTSDTTAFLGGEYLIIPVIQTSPTTTTTTQPPVPPTTVVATTTTTLPPTTTTQPSSGTNFLETFSQSYPITSRNGPLSPTLYSVSRWRSQWATFGNPDTEGNGPALPGDIRVNGGLTIESGMQNYGDTLVRINRPMIGSTLEFDLGVEDKRDGNATVWVTDTPLTTAGFDGENAWGAKPANGFQWTAGCFHGRTFVNYVQTENDVVYCEHEQPSLPAGQSVHYTMTFGADTVTVQGDGFSKTWPLTLNGPKWIMIGSHNHATQKYSQRPTFVSRWDNIEFEAGDVVPVAQVQNGTAPTGGVDPFGYTFDTEVTTGPATSGAARLVFNVGIDGYNAATRADWRINVQANGGEVQSVPFPFEQHGATDTHGNYVFSVPVNAIEGPNTFRISTSGLTTTLTPHFANVDLITLIAGPVDPPTTTTTTVPATTTTQTPTTTTTAPPATTTTAVPTTAVPPTTTQPPAGLMFSENFATEAGFYDRFDFGMSIGNQDTALNPTLMQQWQGDHNAMCSGPELLRDVHIHPGMGPVTPEQVATQTGKSQIWWWCAPGNDPAKGHLMTATNGEGYQIAWFSPKQVFNNVSRVCWDQNDTSMDAKWTNVVIATVGDVEAARQLRGFLDMGFDPPGFQDPSGPTTGIVGDNSVGVKVSTGNMSFWMGRNFSPEEEIYSWYLSTDKATRHKHCMIDNGNGTITLAQNRPAMCNRFASGLQPCGYREQVVPGSFPDGDVRVVFEDDMYDPPKRDRYDPTRLTWHWDNIEIS